MLQREHFTTAFYTSGNALLGNDGNLKVYFVLLIIKKKKKKVDKILVGNVWWNTNQIFLKQNLHVMMLEVGSVTAEFLTTLREIISKTNPKRNLIKKLEKESKKRLLD